MSVAMSEIAEVWCATLGVDTVDPSDDFFDLGGHSLIAMRVVAQVDSLANTTLNVNILLDNPTLAEFHAAVVRAAEGA